MVYHYNIGYHSYEDSEYHILCHEKLFSEDELEDLITAATIRVLEGGLKGKYSIRLYCSGPSFEDIIGDVVKELIEKDGFTPLKFDANWSCFGWPSLIIDNDWGRQRDENLNNISSKIPQDLKDKIMEKMKRNDKDFMEELEECT